VSMHYDRRRSPRRKDGLRYHGNRMPGGRDCTVWGRSAQAALSWHYWSTAQVVGQSAVRLYTHEQQRSVG